MNKQMNVLKLVFRFLIVIVIALFVIDLQEMIRTYLPSEYLVEE